MPINRPETALIAELHEHYTESFCQTLLQLLNIMILRAREDNDTAVGDSVIMNQGEIRAYKQLSDRIVRGLPGV